MSEPIISRVYSIQVSGFDDAEKKIKSLSDEFKKLDDIKSKLNEALAKKVVVGDVSGVKELTAQLKEQQKLIQQISAPGVISPKQAAAVQQAATNENQKAALDREKKSVDALASSYFALKNQRLELDRLTKDASITSPIAFNGQSFTQTEALDKIKEIRAQEQGYIEQLRTEKSVQENLIITQQGKVDAVRLERTELENITKNSSQASVVSFRGQDLTQSDALARIQLLKTEERQLSVQQNTSTAQLIAVKKQLSTVEKAEADQSLIDGREKLLQIRTEREELEKLTATNQQNNSTNEVLPGTFNPGVAALRSGPAPSSFVASTDTERSILALVEDQRQLKSLQDAQKALNAELKAGNISQTEYDEQIVKSIALQNDLKVSIAATTSELRAQAKSNFAIPNTIEDLQARNSVLSRQAAQIPVVNASPEDIENLKLINAEINKNNDLILVNKDLLAQQRLNIGNYQNSFTGALAVIQTELQNVNTKLSGTLTVQDIDVFTKRQDLLKKSTATLSQEFTSAAAQSQAFKNVAAELGGEFGKNSDVFRNFTAQVASANVPIAQSNKIFKETGEQGPRVTNVFQRMYSGLRQLANLLPGIGISGIVLLLLGPLEAAGAAIVRSFKAATQALTGLSAEAQKRLDALAKASSDINEEFIKTSTAGVTKLELLRNAITDTTKSQNDRVEALREFNKVADAGNKLDESQINNLTLINDRISKQITLIQQRALATASEKILADRAEKLLLAQETARVKAEKEQEAEDTHIIETAESEKTDVFFRTLQREGEIREKIAKDQNVKDAQASVDAAKDIAKQNLDNININPGSRTIDAIKQDLKNTIKIFDAAINGSPEKAQLKLKIEALKKELIDAGGAKAPKETGSKLDVADQERIKVIETTQDRLLATENTSANQIELVRQLSFDEERQHLLNVEKINIDALNSKIALLNQKKKLNAEEAKDKAVFGKQITDIELETSQKIDAINKKQFDQESASLKKTFEAQKSQIELQLALVNQNPNNSDEDKAIAKKNSDQKLLDLTKDFYSKLNALAVKDKVSAADVEQEKQHAISDLIKAGLNDNLNITEAKLKDIETATDAAIAKIKRKFDALRSLKPGEDNPQLDAAQNLETTATQLSGDNALLRQAENDIANFKQATADFAAGTITQNVLDTISAGTVSQKQYDDIVSKVQRDQIDLAKLITANVTKVTDLKSLITNSIQSLFNFGNPKADAAKLQQAATDFSEGKITQQAFDETSKAIEGNIAKRQLFAATASEAFDVAKNAMNDFFEAEKSQIERSNQLMQKRLDIELQQAKDQAQSQAERDSLDRQFAAKKEDADRLAFEKNKKLQEEQLKINLAVQLSNLAVLAFSITPANALTLGVAGAIMYAIQAAIAIAAYELNLSKVKSAQFAGGGYTGPGKQRDNTGHRVAGVVHEDEWVSPKWMVRHPKYGPVIQDLEEVRKKGSSRTVITTTDLSATSIYSREIKAYASGGFTGFDSMPGAILTAPFNPQAFLNAARNSSNGSNAKTEEQLSSLMDMIKETSRQTNQRIDNIKVQVVSKEVDDKNTKIKKAINISRV